MLAVSAKARKKHVEQKPNHCGIKQPGAELGKINTKVKRSQSTHEHDNGASDDRYRYSTGLESRVEPTAASAQWASRHLLEKTIG